MDLEVKIVTKADLAQAKAFAATLEKQIAQAKAANKEFASYQAQLNRVNSAINAADISTRRHSGTIATMAGNLKGAIAGFIGLNTAQRILSTGIRELIEDEEALNKVNAALTARGIFSPEFSNQLVELSKRMQDLTKIEDDKWLDTISKLIQFGADSSNINQAVEAVGNLAGRMGGDLNSAANAVGKALSGSVEALSRYVGGLDDAKTDSEKLALAFEKLKSSGGQLEATASGLSGSIKGLDIQWKEFTKSVFDKEAYTEGAKLLTGLLDIFQRLINIGKSATETTVLFWQAVYYKIKGETAGDNPFKVAKDGYKGIYDAARGAKGEVDQVTGEIKSTGISAAGASRGLSTYKKEISDIESKVHDLSDALAALNKELDQQASHEEKMAGFAKDQEIAALDAEKASREKGPVYKRGPRGRVYMAQAGKMTEGEYDARKYGIEQKYKIEGISREIETQQGKIAARQQYESGLEDSIGATIAEANAAYGKPGYDASIYAKRLDNLFSDRSKSRTEGAFDRRQIEFTATEGAAEINTGTAQNQKAAQGVGLAFQRFQEANVQNWKALAAQFGSATLAINRLAVRVENLEGQTKNRR